MKTRLTPVSDRVRSILTTNGLDPERIVRPAPNFDPREFKGRREVGSAFHGLTRTDNMVINGSADGGLGEPAWNGLGLRVEGIVDGKEMLRRGGIDWTVVQQPLVALGEKDEDGSYETTSIDTHVANLRSDNGAVLGVVGKFYKPFNNEGLVEIAQALGKDAVVETVGTLQGGRRVWVLIRTATFDVGQNDPNVAYLAVASSHDGSMGIQMFWTSVRVVCLNTLRRALGGRKGGFWIRHEGNPMKRVEEAKAALGLASETTQAAAAEALALNARTMTREELQRFWLSVYEAAESPIPANPKTEEESKAAAKAKATLAVWGELFDQDRKRTGGGATLWTATNAVTEYYDHVVDVRAANDFVRSDKRVFSNFFGSSHDRKTLAYEMALTTL